jgi:hypothetical protein
MPIRRLASRYLVPAGCLGALAVAYQVAGLPGVAVGLSALVMWILLHFTRVVQVLKRAADRPVGYVDSAVMLHTKLHAGVNLVHVVALTRSLGALESPKDAQPEVFRWTDGSQTTVQCTFIDGKLSRWELQRAPEPEHAP